MRDRGGKRTPLRWRGTLAPPLRAFAKRSLVGALIAAVLLLASASTAFAAPANDRFEDAQVLGPALPVLVSGSNVGATKEASGEPYDTFAAGHSVWFSWEAQSDELVTVDTCGSSFKAILAGFTGPDLEQLEEIGRDYNGGTPACGPGEGAALTFSAEIGTIYWIRVDGESFYLEGPPPVTEGSFSLRVAATPSPPNDDFDHAMTLEGHVTEEPSGARPYYASAQGYNWNATKQVGEPDHAGDPGGASVWFDWSAPESGTAEVNACASMDSLLAVYTGASVDALTPVAGETVRLFGSPSLVPCVLSFATSAGTTYRIAVDGKRDMLSGKPWMDKFWISAAMQLKPHSTTTAAGPTPVSPRDTTAPRTTLVMSILRSRRPVYIFHFSSDEPGSTFRCKLDKHRFIKCRSPKRLSHLRPGRHTLRVFAVDPAGNRDRSPAVARFAVKPRMRESRR